MRRFIVVTLITVVAGCVFYFYQHASDKTTVNVKTVKSERHSKEKYSTNAITINDKISDPDNLTTNDTDKLCTTLRCIFPDTDLETVIKYYVRGYLGLEISAEKNRYYFETNKDFVLTQAKLGDWDAIELLLMRLDPHSIEVSDRVISSNNKASAEYFAEQRQLYHEFFIADVEQRMQVFHEVVVIAAAYGRTASLDYSQRYEWSGKRAVLSGKLAAIYDGDTHSKPFLQKFISRLSDEEQDRLKSDARALHQEVENKRMELGNFIQRS